VISNEQDLRSCFPVSVKVNRQLFLVVNGLPLTGLHAGSEVSVNPVIVGTKKKTHSFARGERVCQTVYTSTSLKCSSQGGGGRHAFTSCAISRSNVTPEVPTSNKVVTNLASPTSFTS
jgi:hypothetical protein